jgi:hypothetical protein
MQEANSLKAAAAAADAKEPAGVYQLSTALSVTATVGQRYNGVGPVSAVGKRVEPVIERSLFRNLDQCCNFSCQAIVGSVTIFEPH